MNIEQPKDFPEDDADEAQLPLPEDGPAEGDDVETIDVPLASPAADADVAGPVAAGGITPPIDVADTSTSLADESAAVAASAPANTQSRSRIQQIDWSKMTPAPGYADPITGKIRWMPMDYNPLDGAVRDLAEGRRQDSQGETAPGIFEPPPVSNAEPRQGCGFVSGNQDSIDVNVQVDLAEESLGRISTIAVSQSSHEAHESVRVLAQRLSEFIDEQWRLENARRLAWGR